LTPLIETDGVESKFAFNFGSRKNPHVKVKVSFFRVSRTKQNKSQQPKPVTIIH
jgi:hypothetical protein